MAIEKDKQNNPSPVQAPSGTYEYLRGIRGRLFNSPDHQIGYSVQEERLCQETGGSCTDLKICRRIDVGHEELHVHVTDTNMIVVSENVIYDCTAPPDSSWRLGPTPDITYMINMVKDLRSRYDDPYEKSLI